MRILHYYDNSDDMVSQHVKMLTENMGPEAENYAVAEEEKARTLLCGTHYDVLHIHGCWRNATRSIVKQALHQGTRLVLTPHGQLEPWIQKEDFWKEKLPKRILYQRDIVQHAYAVVVQGQMEQECMEQLGWNRRLLVIRNAVLTSSTTTTEMSQKTFSLYRKVMDSNPLELMNDSVQHSLRSILLAGTTGDKRWLDPSDTMPSFSNEEWRLLLCFAHQEHIMDTMMRGIRVLGLNAPDIDTAAIDFFLPDKYQETKSIQEVIGNQFPSENERLLATFRLLRKWSAAGLLSIRHLIELNRELRQYPCNEEELVDELKERRLFPFASRIMQLMDEQTGLTEGFMPMPPTNDRTTRRIARQIRNHLKI